MTSVRPILGKVWSALYLALIAAVGVAGTVAKDYGVTGFLVPLLVSGLIDPKRSRVHRIARNVLMSMAFVFGAIFLYADIRATSAR
jgi:hypothetical protein